MKQEIITFDVWMVPSGNVDSIIRLNFELYCFGKQQRSGWFNNIFVIGLVRPIAIIVKPTSNL
jgi:hypothetical protein